MSDGRSNPETPAARACQRPSPGAARRAAARLPDVADGGSRARHRADHPDHWSAGAARGAPAQSQPAPVAPNPDRLRDYQERLRAMEARQALRRPEPRRQRLLQPPRFEEAAGAARQRIRLQPIASAASTRACSPATSCSADARRLSARTAGRGRRRLPPARRRRDDPSPRLTRSLTR